MKAVAVLALAGLAAAQFQGLPTCAQSCANKYLQAGIGNCGSDAKCICSDNSFLSGIACCLAAKDGGCDAADQSSAVSFASQLCAANGVTVPSAVQCTSTASGAAASGTAAPATASAASTATATATGATTSTTAAASSTTATPATGATSSTSTAATTSTTAATTSASSTTAATSTAAPATTSASASKAWAPRASAGAAGAGLVGGIVAALALL